MGLAGKMEKRGILGESWFHMSGRRGERLGIGVSEKIFISRGEGKREKI